MCTACGMIVGPRPREADWATWTWCAEPCLHTAVRWRDGHKGLLEVTSLHGPNGVLVIGLNNRFIMAMEYNPDHEGWRRAHEEATDAPGYLFDSSKRDCWAVIVRPGQSNDVFFIPYGEAWQERL